MAGQDEILLKIAETVTRRIPRIINKDISGIIIIFIIIVYNGIS